MGETGMGMMVVGRIFGAVLLLAGIASGVGDLLSWQETGAFRLSAAGERWFQFSPDTLNLAQALTQRYLAPEVWDPYMQTVLLWPAVLVLGVPGLVLLWLFRRR